jgi:hypothetical protein
LGFYSGMSGRVRTVYLFTLRVVSLLSSRFTASAWVWCYIFLKCLAFHFFISLSTVFICRYSWILWLLMYQVAFGMDWRILNSFLDDTFVFHLGKNRIFLNVRIPTNLVCGHQSLGGTYCLHLQCTNNFLWYLVWSYLHRKEQAVSSSEHARKHVTNYKASQPKNPQYWRIAYLSSVRAAP